MKSLRPLPNLQKIWQQIGRDSERFMRVLYAVTGPSIGEGKYLHWDKLVHYPPPDELSHEEWWFALKFRRQGLYREIPLTSLSGEAFKYVQTSPVPEVLHKIDLGAGGLIEMPAQITNPDTKDRYYVNSLMEEAITSSQLEGAATTRQVAREMIRAGRQPRDRHERMILNNYLTMRRIAKFRDSPLSPELIFEIHRSVTSGTLNDSTAAGRLRTPKDEPVVVADSYGTVFHTPPPPEELETRMESMCAFANGDIPGEFVHPVVRSIALHFWLAYDHPFVDGNGRTARALFYWSMLRHGYWLFEFISISSIILKGPSKYFRAFLYTETDENDLTYFLLYHLDVIERAIEQLHRYIAHKADQLLKTEQEMRAITRLNHRQRALISHALRHPGAVYTYRSHQTSHDVVYQTARTDLLDLEARGLLEVTKIGKKLEYRPIQGLEVRLREMSSSPTSQET